MIPEKPLFRRLLLALGISAALLALPALPARADSLDSISWEATLNADFSHGPYNPFWLNANRYGLSSVKPDNGYLSLGAFKHQDPGKRFSWGAGAQVAVPWNFTSSFVLQQLYGEVSYRCLDLMVGAKQLEQEISNTRLASGNLVESANAQPIPQIRAGIFDYASIWGLKGWLSVKGHVAYGAFTDGSWEKKWETFHLPDGTTEMGHYNKGVLYCSRALWLRNGNPDKFPLTLEVGLMMETQFAGEAWNYRYFNSGDYLKMPRGFKDFVKAIIPKGGDKSTPMSEQTNVQGNMLGSWNYALKWEPLDKSWSVKAYFQHYFEDHSMLYIDYPWKDGLYGLEGRLPKNPWVSGAVYEFLYSKDQSGAVNWTVTPEVPGNAAGADNYYNHNIYCGWQNRGMAIGNPLFLSPVYNDPHYLSFLSTRLIAHHVGLCGNPTPEIDWRVLFSAIRSWGTYRRPYPEVREQYSGLAEVSWRPSGKLAGWEGTVGLAMDRGDLVGHNLGVQLTITRRGVFKF